MFLLFFFCLSWGIGFVSTLFMYTIGLIYKDMGINSTILVGALFLPLSIVVITIYAICQSIGELKMLHREKRAKIEANHKKRQEEIDKLLNKPLSVLDK
jgi:hypothetical protein